MTTVHRPPTPVTIVSKGKGWQLQEVISKSEPAGEDWRAVGKRGAMWIWQRRVITGAQKKEQTT